ncbi:MAG: hypothetical protein D6B27_10695 [Gammaproteobacteria bacterium]|nr:MAG: hypothetical protein D6B27_10695 [Gammaproteobacteria bacterium]
MNAKAAKSKGKKAIILGAGGPLGGLEAGALLALEEKGVKFDIVSGACIGSILALAYSSPANGMTPAQAIEVWCNVTGVSDEIYDFMPINYKIFQKDAGALSSIWDSWCAWMIQNNPFFSTAPDSSWQRLYNDLYILWLTMFAPSTLNPESKGLSRIARSLQELIDFEKLPNVDKDVYINALNVTDKKAQLFSKKEITIDHVIAGSSLYYIANQTEIDGKIYAEGSYIDCLNYKGVTEAHKDIDTIVVMNILNRRALIREPENLNDAYNLSVMLPFVTIAGDDTKIFEAKYKGDINLLKVPLEIPEENAKTAIDWSYSNFQALKEIGYKAGLKFYDDNKDLLA